MRYSRQEAFRHLSDKQELLLKSKVAIVGCGGLGSNAAEMLARAGVGHLVLIDNDKVELSNLQRQALYTEDDVEKFKALAAKDMLEKINSEVKVAAHTVLLAKDNIDLLSADLVLDCTDNLETRRLINSYCYGKKPWIFAAVVGAKGMVMDFLPDSKFCFECVFRDAKPLETSETSGILNTAVKAVSAFQATEALKILAGEKVSGELVHIDVWKQTIERIKVKRNKNCNVCEDRD